MKRALLSLCSLLFLFSCGQRHLSGSGEVVTDNRTLSAFSAIENAGSTDIEIYPASSPRVEVSGYENLVRAFETEVRNGALHLHFKDGFDIRNSNIQVRVYSPGVTRIEHAGSGDIMVHPGAKTLVREADLAGSGNITINQSDAPDLVLSISGSGGINARSAHAASVAAEITGSGEIETYASAKLQATITGSGQVHCWGSPRISKEITGSGDVVQH